MSDAFRVESRPHTYFLPSEKKSTSRRKLSYFPLVYSTTTVVPRASASYATTLLHGIVARNQIEIIDPFFFERRKYVCSQARLT